MSNKINKETFRSNRQLIYGVILVLVIPLLVVSNSLFFIRQFNEVLTREQQRQAILIGQMTEAFIIEKIDSPDALQELIEKTLSRNSELSDFSISKPENGEFFVWAAIDREMVGTINEKASAFFAIQRKEPVAQRISRGVNQFWEIQYPIINTENSVIALITLQLSTADIDAETGSLIFKSFIFLAIIVMVIILLLASNTRLFQYAILYRRLKEIDKAKDDFISIASHELRTPITAMRNYFSMVLEGSFGKISDEIKDSLVMMTGNAERLNNLVEDLLNVSRLQQGRISISLKNIDLVPIIDDIVKSLEPTAQEKKLSLTFENKKEQIIAYADPDRVRQVIVNIIGNALKYTEKGSVVLTIAEEQKHFSIKVKDTGMGISAEAQQQLFEKFYRVINKKTQNITGTGLGLWLTRELLRLMDGKIFIDSIESVGTQVTITLPLGKSKLDNKGSV